MDKQCTIKDKVQLSGTGLHTGKPVNLTFIPAGENYGRKFCRTDLENKPVIPADVEHVVDTSRGTTIGINGAMVYTVEHVLAALSGLQIDNVLIEIDGPEMPILDGSAKLIVDALQKVGKVEQNAIRKYFEITENVVYSNPETGSEIIAIPSPDFKVSVMIDFGYKVLGSQNATLDNIDQFEKEIAPCRTFVFLHELEYLLKNNLVKGGDLNNAIVFMNKAVSQEELDRLATLFEKPSVEVKPEGILNNLDLNFNNEPARHKLLDVIGDISLAGMPIKGHIIANKPGHHANTEFAKLLKEQIRKKSVYEVPKYDIYKKPVYDINEIMKRLPHRPPFLLIDKIMEISDNHVVGIKNVTMNEQFFVGHFPEEPVMPGVLQIEAMAQAGGIFILDQMPEIGAYSTYFIKIEEAKFRKKVVPGDVIVFRLELVSPIRRGLCHMKGIATVGDKVAMEAILLAQITKKENV